mmetsp:Transcript_22525/g.38158  ORF Transcript_22525/g.38158 Transcript_22525/m.38158 type:complete len:212 (+) Transcript_22525:911-1546(+)
MLIQILNTSHTKRSHKSNDGVNSEDNRRCTRLIGNEHNSGEQFGDALEAKIRSSKNASKLRVHHSERDFRNFRIKSGVLGEIAALGRPQQPPSHASHTSSEYKHRPANFPVQHDGQEESQDIDAITAYSENKTNLRPSHGDYRLRQEECSECIADVQRACAVASQQVTQFRGGIGNTRHDATMIGRKAYTHEIKISQEFFSLYFSFFGAAR